MGYRLIDGKVHFKSHKVDENHSLAREVIFTGIGLFNCS